MYPVSDFKWASTTIEGEKKKVTEKSEVKGVLFAAKISGDTLMIHNTLGIVQYKTMYRTIRTNSRYILQYVTTCLQDDTYHVSYDNDYHA